MPYPQQQIAVTLLESAVNCLRLWKGEFYKPHTSFTSAEDRLLAKLEDALEAYRNETGGSFPTSDEPDLPF